MTEDERKLGLEFVDLYKLLALQQDAISRVMIGAEVLRDLQSVSVERFEEKYDERFVLFSASAIGVALQKTQNMLAAKIASLKQTYGSWEN